jgi:hypothetical protein
MYSSGEFKVWPFSFLFGLPVALFMFLAALAEVV